MCLDGETGTADAGAVADGVGIVGSAEEYGAVCLCAGIEPEFISALGRFENQNAILGFRIQNIRLDSHSVLIVLDCLLSLCRPDGEQHQNCDVK